MIIILIRTVFLYALIVFSLRLMGKRQLGELQPSELVVAIIVSNIATLSIEDNTIPLMGSILPILMLACCEILISVIIMKSSKARKIVEGNPCVIIRDGVIDQKGMKSLRWTIDDLMEQLRVNNIFDINEVNYAVVETSGKLTSFQKLPARTPTVEMMALQVDQEEHPPMLLINDGELIESAFQYLNLRREWLDKVLAQENLTIPQVFLMSCNRRAQYFIVRKEGKKS